MFGFLKRLGQKDVPENETQRERFTRLVRELNEAISELPEPPAITINPQFGLDFSMPEQFPDEAIALPRPDDTHNDDAKPNETLDAATDQTNKTDEKRS